MFELTTNHNNVLKTITEQTVILKETRKFYKELYTRVPVSIRMQQLMLNKLDKKLTKLQADKCEGILTDKELRIALSELNNGKMPGLDGLTTEFYKTFIDILIHELTQLTLSIEKESKFSETQRKASITTLPKKGDLTLLENWRPLSILNTDYKIITKALANRLMYALPHIIYEDQTCNIKGRIIQYNLSIIRDMITYANTTKDKLSIVSLDQMKAFDKLDWSFLNKILEKFNFGSGFIKWINIIQTNISSAVKVNGQLSKQFPVQQGVRQGCPLSPLLYVIYAEILAVNLRKYKNIKGIKIN